MNYLFWGISADGKPRSFFQGLRTFLSHERGSVKEDSAYLVLR